MGLSITETDTSDDESSSEERIGAMGKLNILSLLWLCDVSHVLWVCGIENLEGVLYL